VKIGVLRRVAWWKFADVSEMLAASIIRTLIVVPVTSYSVAVTYVNLRNLNATFCSIAAGLPVPNLLVSVLAALCLG
jgi:hypothetical protein